MYERLFRMSADEPLTTEKLSEFIQANKDITETKYRPLALAYFGDYDIFHRRPKKEWKPDNRIAINYAKYITDTFAGFFLGNPVKISAAGDQTEIAEWVNQFDDEQDEDHKLNQVLMEAIRLGVGYEMIYVDEESNIRTAITSATDSFIIYDTSITPKKLYFCHYYLKPGTDNIEMGSISNSDEIIYFVCDPELRFTDIRINPFGCVPAVAYCLNDARIGLYEPVLGAINGYNNVLSEQENDIQAITDAILKVVGPTLDEKSMEFLRDNHVLNIPLEPGQTGDGDFISKGADPGTIDAHLDRLEKAIFTTSMVCNFSDESFGTSSGIALQHKTMQMLNLMRTAERNFTGAFNEKYKIIFGCPLCPLQEEDWHVLRYKFTPNLPLDIESQAETANKLAGIVSQRTVLGTLSSVVDNVDEELEQMRREDEEAATPVDYEITRAADDDDEREEDQETS